jgi:hypothetical protein
MTTEFSLFTRCQNLDGENLREQAVECRLFVLADVELPF